MWKYALDPVGLVHLNLYFKHRCDVMSETRLVTLAVLCDTAVALKQSQLRR